MQHLIEHIKENLEVISEGLQLTKAPASIAEYIKPNKKGNIDNTIELPIKSKYTKLVMVGLLYDRLTVDATIEDMGAEYVQKKYAEIIDFFALTSQGFNQFRKDLFAGAWDEEDRDSIKGRLRDNILISSFPNSSAKLKSDEFTVHTGPFGVLYKKLSLSKYVKLKDSYLG